MRRLLAAAAVASALALPSSASATIVRPFTLPAMTLEAQSVVRGVVVDAEVVYDAQWRRVYTHTTVRVVETLSGAARPGDLIVVRQIGGELDGVRSRVVGTADLELGAEVVLFTRTDGALHYLVGMAQGCYAVDRTGAEPRVARALGGLRVLPLPPVARAPAPDRATLDDLRARVAAALQDAGRTP